MMALFRDPAVRFGLKLGIGGLLATYLALVLRLDEPTWALFTVFVLMVTPYVGSIMEKSVLRIFGTMIGAILGYLLLGWQQEPLIFLPVVAGVLTFCVAMFGQSLWSYGFFLCGLTLIDVMQAGLRDPQMSWRFALTRAEEVVLGILVAVVVQSVLWPRYARVEFDKLLKETLADLKHLLTPAVESLFTGGSTDTLEQARKFPVRLAKMRALINFGARENREFRAWVPVLAEITDQLNLMALSIATLSKPLTPAAQPYPALQDRMQDLGRAIAEGLQALVQPDAKTTPDAALLRVQQSRRELENFLEQAKKRGDFAHEEPAYLFSLGHHFLALDELAQALSAIHERLALMATGQKEKIPAPAAPGPSLPTPFWIHLGIKGGIAVVSALLLEDWLHPPGGELLAISTWILLVRGPTAPAGRGDWRAFHGAVLSILAWLLLGLLLLAAHPLLASYAVINIVLFSLLFLWGYVFYGRNPMTTPMLVGMLMIVGIFGLNAQKPVSFQDIVDLSVGTALAILLSALIRRLLWPSLPQREILVRLRELAQISRRILRRGIASLSAKDHGRLALIPGETSTRLGLLKWPMIASANRDLIEDYLHALYRGALVLSAAARQSEAWPASLTQDSLYEKAVSLKNDFQAHLLAHEELLQHRKISDAPFSQFEEIFTDRKKDMAGLCRTSSPHLPVVQWLSLLAFCKRMEEAGEALLHAARISSQLDWSELKEDSSL